MVALGGAHVRLGADQVRHGCEFHKDGQDASGLISGWGIGVGVCPGWGIGIGVGVCPGWGIGVGYVPRMLCDAAQHAEM